MTDQPQERQRWQLDRHVPIAVIVALAANLLWGTWQASQLTALVASIEQRVSKLEQGELARAIPRQQSLDRLTRIETEFLGQKVETNRRLDSIDDKLDRILENWIGRSP